MDEEDEKTDKKKRVPLPPLTKLHQLVEGVALEQKKE